jgi:hypothetical protein
MILSIENFIFCKIICLNQILYRKNQFNLFYNSFNSVDIINSLLIVSAFTNN